MAVPVEGLAEAEPAVPEAEVDGLAELVPAVPAVEAEGLAEAELPTPEAELDGLAEVEPEVPDVPAAEVEVPAPNETIPVARTVDAGGAGKVAATAPELPEPPAPALAAGEPLTPARAADEPAVPAVALVVDGVHEALAPDVPVVEALPAVVPAVDVVPAVVPPPDARGEALVVVPALDARGEALVDAPTPDARGEALVDAPVAPMLEEALGEPLRLELAAGEATPEAEAPTEEAALAGATLDVDVPELALELPALVVPQADKANAMTNSEGRIGLDVIVLLNLCRFAAWDDPRAAFSTRAKAVPSTQSGPCEEPSCSDMDA